MYQSNKNSIVKWNVQWNEKKESRNNNPISISDSDGDEDFVPPSTKQLAERRRLNHAVKEEPKDSDNVLKSVPVKGEY